MEKNDADGDYEAEAENDDNDYDVQSQRHLSQHWIFYAKKNEVKRTSIPYKQKE